MDGNRVNQELSPLAEYLALLFLPIAAPPPKHHHYHDTRYFNIPIR